MASTEEEAAHRAAKVVIDSQPFVSRAAEKAPKKKRLQVIKFYFYVLEYRRDFHQILCFPADSFALQQEHNFSLTPCVMKAPKGGRMRCCLCQMP